MNFTPTTSAQSVSFWPVHKFVTEILKQVNGWPMAGTPAWCSLTHEDPAKWAALLDAAQHHALRVDMAQEALADASHEISVSADWRGIAGEVLARELFWANHPWVKRVAS